MSILCWQPIHWLPSCICYAGSLSSSRVTAPYALDDAEAAFKRALELDGTYFDALVELMHFYDAVCADPSKALAYAKQVKALAQKALDEASDVLEDTTTSVS